MFLKRIFLLAFLGAFMISGNAQSLTDSTLVYDWEALSEEDATGSPFGQVLSFAEGGTFTTATGESGTWELQRGSLLLRYELLPVSTPVDSLSYEVSQGNPSLKLMNEGKVVATHTQAGFDSERREKTYAASLLPNGNLVLTSGDQTYELKGRPLLKESPFSIMDIFRGFLGIIAVLLACYLLSANRQAINWRLVGTGIAMQLVFAILVLKVPGVVDVFSAIAGGFVKILGFTQAGSQFIFGGLVNDVTSFGFIFAFQVLPTIIFFSAVTSVLYYMGVLQKIVFGFAWVMTRFMKLSGAESLAAAGNVFLGQTESPLLIKPYLDKMTRSEILCLMAGGMATIAGSVFAAYVLFLGGNDPVQQQLFATHLLTASILAAPAAIVASKMLLPETEQVNTDLTVPKDRIGSNALDAIANGTTEGTKLAVNVAVMLLVFLAFIAAFNFLFADLIGNWTGINDWVAEKTSGRYQGFTLEYIFGILFSPIAWLLGVPADDMVLVGQFLGQKTIANEFVAYSAMADAKSAGLFVHYKSMIISTYALCGFANISSIGIQIGGIGALAPGQRKTLSELGVKALIGGTVAAFLTASVAGMMVAI